MPLELMRLKGAVTSQTVFTIFPVLFFGLVLVITQESLIGSLTGAIGANNQQFLQNNVGTAVNSLCNNNEERAQPPNSNYTRDFGGITGFNITEETIRRGHAGADHYKQLSGWDTGRNSKEVEITLLQDSSSTYNTNSNVNYGCGIGFNGSLTTNQGGLDIETASEGTTALRIFSVNGGNHDVIIQAEEASR